MNIYQNSINWLFKHNNFRFETLHLSVSNVQKANFNIIILSVTIAATEFHYIRFRVFLNNKNSLKAIYNALFNSKIKTGERVQICRFVKL